MLKLTPYCRSTIWGGSRLLDVFPCEGLENLAEAWLFSLMQEGESLVEGVPLSQVLKQRGIPRDISKKMPLIKLIDTDDLLSVQVHPSDEEAKRLDGEESGKNEMWYILAAKPGAYIYLNLKSTKEAFLAELEKQTPTEELTKVCVAPGDVFMLPAGMVHALGAGITLLEIQQPSNLTYRLWDYLRKDSQGHFRPLHLEKAKAVARPYTKEQVEAIRFSHKDQNTYEIYASEKPNFVCAANTPYFKVDILRVKEKSPLALCPQNSPLVLIGLEGVGRAESADGAYPISFGQTLCILPTDSCVTLSGDCQVALVSLPL